MKKLHSFAFYALVTPAIALSSGAVLAEQSTGEDSDQKMQNTQQDQDATKATTGTAQSGQKTGDEAGMKSQGYLDSAPTGGIQASDLISAEIKTNDDEDVGSVTDLIIDKDGQVVAVVVGVGGFLGMAEKDVAIAWDDVTMSRGSEESEGLELRVTMTRDDLQAAPSYENLEN